MSMKQQEEGGYSGMHALNDVHQQFAENILGLPLKPYAYLYQNSVKDIFNLPGSIDSSADDLLSSFGRRSACRW